MNTPFYIAKRYLFTKKSTNAINIISAISMAGVLVGSAALIIILSVFNGFEDLVIKMFNTFTPEIVIQPAKGKTFNPNTAAFKGLRDQKEIFSYTEVLQENALLRYGDKQSVGLVKGVSFDYMKNKDLDSAIVDGSFVLNNSSGYNAVIGSALQSYLGVNTADPFTRLQIFSPKKTSTLNAVNPADDFTIETIAVSGVFEVQEEFDNGIIVPLAFARKLLDEATEVSAIELNLQPGQDADRFIRAISGRLGEGFLVKNRAQQNETLYHMLNTEKSAVYIILTFILIIAIFNIIGSLTMLVIDKIKDIAVLTSLGAGKGLIRRIFLFEGLMITMIGCVAGLLIGLIFCIMQQKYGLVQMGSNKTAIISAYPVHLKWKDFVLVFLTVGIISFLASALSSNLSVRRTGQLTSDL
ncbi:FtsX-like permease family protein [Pedobacter sp. SYP-B3415]|uniref:FtsX-like permease family protein n=1 Tax=Pedobacter sp. SYP-B3415 TaxID=2496641 RepID=UPI00101D788F|nr:FtsX-like permease family protein [Pedobacter sp. SYP-B3415]